MQCIIASHDIYLVVSDMYNNPLLEWYSPCMLSFNPTYLVLALMHVGEGKSFALQKIYSFCFEYFATSYVLMIYTLFYMDCYC